MKLLILNGPNLNLLGLREPEIYGDRNYAALVSYVEEVCQREGIECRVFQSNHEGALVDEIQAAYGVYDGIVINPYERGDPGRPQGGAHPRGGGASFRCQRPGGVPAGVLCRDGLYPDLRGLRLCGVRKGSFIPEGLSAKTVNTGGCR